MLIGLNGKTRSKKMGLGGVFRKEEDATMITWPLHGLSISLQQPKMKVTELTQTRATPSQDGILSNSWWYNWFKRKHQEVNIW